jgi:predicted AlkP superfamily pyrophosphatase or phosphodiesterase
MLLTRKLFTILVLSFLAPSLFAAGRASHMLLIVWDGMRPDFVTEQTTPALIRLARRGVTFKNHHPVYLSTTEVNGTALATGAYPGESGIIGNKEFRPAWNASEKIMTESPVAVRKGDKLTGGHYLGFPTVAEMLHRHGLPTAIAGTKGVALLQDRAARRVDALGINLFAGEALPEGYADPIKRALGEFPPEGLTKTNCDLWTTRALIGPLWEKQVPVFSVLWLSEPDLSQHETGPGSPTAIAAIRHSDDALARVLAALDQKGLGAETDVVVVSDHGFSTIDENADVAKTLNAQGFHAYRTVPYEGARAGDVMVVGNGGSVFLYVTGHQPSLVERIVHCLQAQPFCGVVFTQTPVEGAFRLHDVRIDSSFAPDIVLSLRWRPDNGTNGASSMIYSDYGQYGPGQGMHGSLSPSDMHNICLAAGPDFRKGVEDDLPSGNIDVAPTILWLLGIKPERQLSGRVLAEAMSEAGDARPPWETHHLEASWRNERFTWRQYLKYSEVSGVLYFEEGNGEQILRKDLGGK